MKYKTRLVAATCLFLLSFITSVIYAKNLGNDYSLISNGKSTDGLLNSKLYLNEASIEVGKLNPNFVYAWFLFITDDNNSIQNRFLINCSNYYYSNLIEIERDSDGKVISNNTYPIEFHRSIGVGFADSMVKSACAAKEQLQNY